MTVELPQDRVVAYIDGLGDTRRESIDEYGYGPEHHGLSISDLRDVLAELVAHQELLIELDSTLDMFGHEPHVAITIIRSIMGNHTNGRGD